MAVPRVLSDHYLTEVVGSGRYGVVFYATNRENDVFAAKCISKSHIRTKSTYLRLEREISTLQQVSSPHVVKLHNVFQTDHNIYLLMEYCAGPSLKTVIGGGNLKMHLVRRWLTNIVDACLALKAKKIMHRDLKPANVMLTHADLELAQAKLVDFGLAKYESDIEARLEHSKVGSPRYMAPEIRIIGQYNCSVDVYSFGKLAEELLKATVVEDQDAAMRENANHMVQAALTFDPFLRPCFEQLSEMAFFLPLFVPIEINEPQHLRLSNIPIDQSDCDGPSVIFLSIYKKCCAAKEIRTLGWTMIDKCKNLLAYWLFRVYQKRINAYERETQWNLAKHTDSGLEALLKETKDRAKEAEADIKDAESRLIATNIPLLDHHSPRQMDTINSELLHYEAFSLAEQLDWYSEVLQQLKIADEALQLLKIAEEECPNEREEVLVWRRRMIEYLEGVGKEPRISMAN